MENDRGCAGGLLPRYRQAVYAGRHNQGQGQRRDRPDGGYATDGDIQQKNDRKDVGEVKHGREHSSSDNNGSSDARGRSYKQQQITGGNGNKGERADTRGQGAQQLCKAYACGRGTAQGGKSPDSRP